MNAKKTVIFLATAVLISAAASGGATAEIPQPTAASETAVTGPSCTIPEGESSCIFACAPGATLKVEASTTDDWFDVEASATCGGITVPCEGNPTCSKESTERTTSSDTGQCIVEDMWFTSETATCVSNDPAPEPCAGAVGELVEKVLGYCPLNESGDPTKAPILQLVQALPGTLNEFIEGVDEAVNPDTGKVTGPIDSAIGPHLEDLREKLSAGGPVCETVGQGRSSMAAPCQ